MFAGKYIFIVLFIVTGCTVSPKTIDTSRNGTYTTGLWTYDYVIKFQRKKSETRIGQLRYDGVNVETITSAKICDYIETPWGIMQFFGEFQNDVPQYLGGWITKETYDMPLKLEDGKRLDQISTNEATRSSKFAEKSVKK